MGVYNIPDIFQENISEICKGFDIVHAYIYNIQVITKNSLQDHLKALEKHLQRLTEA